MTACSRSVRAMDNPVYIEIDGEPVPKGRPRFVSRGGYAMAYTPGPTRTYEEHIRSAARLAMNGRAHLTGPLSVTVTAVRPIPKSWPLARRALAEAGKAWPVTKPDADNYLKIALDGCNAIVFADDNQVCDARIIKCYGATPRLMITIETINEWGEGSA
jgi:Holliday junction resolvase RusA-like endonuclease